MTYSLRELIWRRRDVGRLRSAQLGCPIGDRPLPLLLPGSGTDLARDPLGGNWRQDDREGLCCCSRSWWQSRGRSARAGPVAALCCCTSRERAPTRIARSDGVRAGQMGYSWPMTTGTPWWQATKTPRYGFIFGTFWAVAGLFQMFTFVFGGAHVWTPVLGGGELVLAAVYLSSAAASWRRQRSGTGAASAESPSLPPSS
jgi:hypothetical protein